VVSSPARGHHGDFVGHRKWPGAGIVISNEALPVAPSQLVPITDRPD
jgi:hypothetical protein